MHIRVLGMLIFQRFIRMYQTDDHQLAFETEYSKMDQVKFVKKILLGLLLNTLSHLCFNVSKLMYGSNKLRASVLGFSAQRIFVKKGWL